MRVSRSLRSCFRLLLLALLPAAPTAGLAGSFASAVVSYDPGATPVAGFTDPTAALGSPDDLTGENLGFPAVLSPFNPAFEADEIVSIGEGGHLTLELGRDAVDRSGLDLGVITNSGLVDLAFPTGTTGTPASSFGSDAAVVEVSEDGLSFVPLNGGAPILFDVPGIFYLNAGPFDGTPPASPLRADFGLPFVGSLSDFDGLTFADIVALFAGSGGGTWLDLSGSGLAFARFVRFSVPDDGDAGTSNNFEIDALLASSFSVPEPSVLALFALPLLAAGARRMM